MTRDAVSYALFGLAVVSFASYWVRARRLGRDTSPAGVAADDAARRQLRVHVVVGIIALIGAALL